jgi:spore coat polysaccharide biosynthesis predicted glycosyltransferase SpsG
MKKLLLIAYGGGHINIQVNVARLFLKKGWNVQFLSTPNTTARLKKEGLPFITFKELATEEDIIAGKKIVHLLHNPNSPIDFDESVAYSGINYNDSKEYFGEENSVKLFKNFGRRTFLPVAHIKQYMEQYKPDLVSVTLSSARAERASIIAAKQLGIPVMAIEDLFGTACAFSVSDFVHVKNKQLKFELVKKGVAVERIIVSDSIKSFQVASFHTGINDYIGIRYNFVPDYVFCINEYAKSNIIERGISEENVYVVGHPAFDHLALLRDQKKPESQILVTTQPLDTLNQFLYLIKPALVHLSEKYKVIIRPHPSSDCKQEQEFFGGYANIDVTREGNLHELILKSNLLITQTSTTAIEAAVLNTPVLSIALGNDHLVSFEQAGISKELKNPEIHQVEEAINKLLQIEINNQNILPYCDGKSVERIYKIVTS